MGETPMRLEERSRQPPTARTAGFTPLQVGACGARRVMPCVAFRTASARWRGAEVVAAGGAEAFSTARARDSYSEPKHWAGETEDGDKPVRRTNRVPGPNGSPVVRRSHVVLRPLEPNELGAERKPAPVP